MYVHNNIIVIVYRNLVNNIDSDRTVAHLDNHHNCLAICIDTFVRGDRDIPLWHV